jgi:hypothetical protein
MQQKQLNLAQLSDIKCPCGNAMFHQTFMLKLVPGLLIGLAQNDAAPIPVYQCTKCKNVLNLAEAVKKASVIDQKIT